MMHHIFHKRTFTILLFFSLFTVGTGFAFAEEQVPGSVLVVESDPYYFSEGGLGMGILKFFGRPKTRLRLVLSVEGQ